MTACLALDIGGANLKWADGCGLAGSCVFPLWKQPEQLAAALAEILASATLPQLVAVTMTGELADCFRTKRDGVAAIVQAVNQAVAQLDPQQAIDIRVYGVDGRWHTPAQACERPLTVAASNWHALASYAARWIPDSGLLVDIGSTTSDLIPIRDGRPVSAGLTDPERLASGELAYTGVWRSPLCGIVKRLPWREQSCRVAQELFATTVDAYLVLGDIAEQPAELATADGRPATREFAHDRLARAICADRELFEWSDAVRAAEVVAQAQLDDLAKALQQVSECLETAPQTVVISGQGEFLARRLVERCLPSVEIVSLSSRLGAHVSQAAPAHALAVLAREAFALAKKDSSCRGGS